MVGADSCMMASLPGGENTPGLQACASGLRRGSTIARFCRRRAFVLDVEPLDVGAGGGRCRGAGREACDASPILPRPGHLAFEAADVAAFEQRRRRIGG